MSYKLSVLLNFHRNNSKFFFDIRIYFKLKRRDNLRDNPLVGIPKKKLNNFRTVELILFWPRWIEKQYLKTNKKCYEIHNYLEFV